MADNRRYFYLAGFISLTLFAAVGMLFFFTILIQSSVKSYAMKKDNYISVSLHSVPKATSASASKPAAKPEPQMKPETAVKPPVVKSVPKPISSLFSSVKTQEIVTSKKAPPKRVSQQSLAKIAQSVQAADKREEPKISETLKTLDASEVKTSEKSAADSTGPDVDRYRAEVHALIYKQFFPAESTEGSVAKIRVWIGSDRRLEDMKVLTYSGNPMFDREVDDLKKRLKSAIFPRHPNSQPQIIDIILVAKG